MKIKQGLKFQSRASGIRGRVGEQFDRDHWDDYKDPEWYVHFDNGGLQIISESAMRERFNFDGGPKKPVKNAVA